MEDIREFEGLGYHFEEALSDGENYIFLPKKGEPENEQIQRT